MIETILQALQFDFMRNALLAGAIVGEPFLFEFGVPKRVIQFLLVVLTTPPSLPDVDGDSLAV